MSSTYSHYFSIANVVLFLFYTLIFYYFYSKNKIKIDKRFHKYHTRNFLVKSFLVLLFSFYYVYVVGGGDTVA